MRRRMVLLFVEDERLRGAVAEALRPEAWLTTSIVRSREVLLRVVTELMVPDLVLVEPPAREGAAFIRELRASATRLPIVALVPAEAPADARELLIRAGCDDVVSLPPEAEELRAVLRRLAPPG